MHRNALIKAFRQWFDDHDFLEVDVPALTLSPGNEAHLHAFSTNLVRPDGSIDRRYLHTSPEFACKKLLAAGEQRIFSMGHVFRNRERTATHSPEFTMLEWYRTQESYHTVISDSLKLVALAAEITGTTQFEWRGRQCDPGSKAEWLTVRDAFVRYAGIDIFTTMNADGVPDRDALAAIAPVPCAADDGWSDMFSRILVAMVEPNLGNSSVTVLYEYPSCEAALARTSAIDPRVAERFELYSCGVELANGFGELTDTAEQRRRFEEEMDIKFRIYGERYPLDEDLLHALTLMPPAAGVALGFDRLVMLATGAQKLDQVLWVPVE